MVILFSLALVARTSMLHPGGTPVHRHCLCSHVLFEFCTGDQEALYMRLHNTQRVGRRGMGKSDTLKISGGKWEGSKTTFEEGDGGSGGVGAVMALTAVVGGDPDAEPSAGGENKGKKAKKAKSSKQPATGAAAATETTTKKSKRAKMPEQPAAEAEPAAEPATRLSKKAKGLEPAAEAATVSKKAGTSEQLVAEASATAAAAKKDRKSKRGMQVPSDGPSLQKGKEDGNAAGVAIAVEAAVTGISTHEQPCRKWVKVARKLLKKAPERRLRARALMEQLREHCVGSANQLTSPGSRCGVASRRYCRQQNNLIQTRVQALVAGVARVRPLPLTLGSYWLTRQPDMPAWYSREHTLYTPHSYTAHMFTSIQPCHFPFPAGPTCARR